MVLNYIKYNESIIPEFKVGDDVIVDGVYDSRIFNNLKAKISDIYMSSGPSGIQSVRYSLVWYEDNLQRRWNVRISDKLRISKVEKEEPIKEEDIEWF